MLNGNKIILTIFISIAVSAVAIFYFSSSHFFIGNLQRVQGNKIIGKMPMAASFSKERKENVYIGAKPSFYDGNILQETLLKNESVVAREDILAIISPHHSLAASLIGSIVKEASGRDVSTVVIIAPNHGHVGVEPLAATQAFWQTPFGDLETDSFATDKFMADFGLFSAPEAFVDEHGIGSIAPYVKNYFPSAKVLPILINNSASEKNAAELSDWLVKNMQEDWLVIFSMDFSHYLTKAGADKCDALTREFISARDVGKIIQLNDDYVDTPIGLATSILLAEKAGLEIEIVANGNSFDFVLQKSDSTTSYFTARFIKK